MGNKRRGGGGGGGGLGHWEEARHSGGAGEGRGQLRGGLRVLGWRGFHRVGGGGCRLLHRRSLSAAAAWCGVRQTALERRSRKVLTW